VVCTTSLRQPGSGPAVLGCLDSAALGSLLDAYGHRPARGCAQTTHARAVTRRRSHERREESSNASSNVDEPDRIDANALERVSADHPKHQTASDGFTANRACLLIRGFRVRTSGAPPRWPGKHASSRSPVTAINRCRYHAVLRHSHNHLRRAHSCIHRPTTVSGPRDLGTDQARHVRLPLW